MTIHFYPLTLFRKMGASLWVVVFTLLIGVQDSAWAARQPRADVATNVCVVALTGAAPQAQSTQPVEIRTLDDLFRAFTRNLVVDLSKKSQKHAFEIYLSMKFGDANIKLDGATEQIASELTSHPELKKEPFRNFVLDEQSREYPVTDQLKQFIEPLVKATGQIRSSLFLI